MLLCICNKKQQNIVDENKNIFCPMLCQIYKLAKKTYLITFDIYSDLNMAVLPTIVWVILHTTMTYNAQFRKNSNLAHNWYVCA